MRRNRVASLIDCARIAEKSDPQQSFIAALKSWGFHKLTEVLFFKRTSYGSVEVVVSPHAEILGRLVVGAVAEWDRMSEKDQYGVRNSLAGKDWVKQPSYWNPQVSLLYIEDNPRGSQVGFEEEARDLTEMYRLVERALDDHPHYSGPIGGGPRKDAPIPERPESLIPVLGAR